MPIIKVWCLPDSKEPQLRELHKAIVGAVVGITELGLKNENDMTVLFPPDIMKYGLGTEIIVEVSALFPKPERTPEVMEQLASKLGKTVKALYPKAKVECFVQLFNPVVGFWSSEQTKKSQKKSEGFGSVLKKLRMQIDETSMSVRPFNCLSAHGMRTLGLAMLLPPLRPKMFYMRNFGLSSEVELLNVFTEIGFSEIQIAAAREVGSKTFDQVYGNDPFYHEMLQEISETDNVAGRRIRSLPIWTLTEVSMGFVCIKGLPSPVFSSTVEHIISRRKEKLIQGKLECIAQAIVRAES